MNAFFLLLILIFNTPFALGNQHPDSFAKKVLDVRLAYEESPWNGQRLSQLENIRKYVVYQPQLAPKTDSSFFKRLSPIDFCVGSFVFSILFYLGRSQRRWLMILAILGWLFLLLLTINFYSRKSNVGVVAFDDSTLHTGNAYEYPLAFPHSLAEGMELEILGERGDWVRVQMGEIVGWIPKTNVISAKK